MSHSKPEEREEDDIAEIQTYPVEGVPEALIINVARFYDMTDARMKPIPKSERKGSKDLAVKMKVTLEKIGFKVDLKCNSVEEIQSLTSAKIGVIIEEFLQKLRKMAAEGNSCPMVAVVISSHGGPDRFSIQCADRLKIDVEKDLLQKFANETLPCMIGKPKLFLFQFCRGKQYNKAINRPGISHSFTDFDTNPEIAEKTVPQSLSDAIIAYSTYPTFLSFRSFFFDTFSKVFMQNGLSEEVTRLFKMIAAEMNKKQGTDEDGNAAKQVVEIDYINFSKDLFFQAAQTTGTSSSTAPQKPDQKKKKKRRRE